jgi:hypothetical protein
MSSQTFEILCPICRSVVPLDAPGCPSCARTKRDAAAALRPQAAAPAAAAVAPATTANGRVAPTAPDLASLSMKDYHRVVRATYQATERPATGSSRMRAYLPFALLVLLLAAGAVVLFGHM